MLNGVALEIQEGLLGKIRNDTKKGGTRGQSLRMMNVSYTDASSSTYVKKQ